MTAGENVVVMLQVRRLAMRLLVGDFGLGKTCAGVLRARSVLDDTVRRKADANAGSHTEHRAACGDHAVWSLGALLQHQDVLRRTDPERYYCSLLRLCGIHHYAVVAITILRARVSPCEFTSAQNSHRLLQQCPANNGLSKQMQQNVADES